MLRWSERYTRTDMVYLFRNSGWLIVGQVGVAGTSLLLSIAFAHFVPKDTYGTYRYLLSIFWVLTAFCFTGLPAAVTQAVARGFEGAYLRSFRTSLVWSVPMATIALVASAYYFIAGNMQLGYGLLMIGIFGPLMQPALMYAAFLEGKRDFGRYALYGIALNAVPALLSFAAMFVTKDPLIFVAAYLVGNVGTGLILDLITYKRYAPNTKVNSELTNLGIHFSVMNVLGTIAQQVDKLVVFHYLGAVQLAVYSFATALPEQLKGVLSTVSSLALPKFVTRSMTEVRANFWGRMTQFTLLLVPVTALYILLAPFFFQLFFPAYADAIIYSQIFAVSLIVTSNTVPLALLQAQAAKRELYIYNVISPVFQIGSLFLLTISFGLMGTIFSRIGARVFNLLLLSVLVRSYLNRSAEYESEGVNDPLPN